MTRYSATQCPHCHDVVAATSMHQHNKCSCGKVSIKGTEQYTQITSDVGILADSFQIDSDDVKLDGSVKKFNRILE